MALRVPEPNLVTVICYLYPNGFNGVDTDVTQAVFTANGYQWAVVMPDGTSA